MIRYLMTVSVCLVTMSHTSADGVQDNIPDNVRRIPKDGIEIPPEREAAMRASLLTLQQKLEQLRAIDQPKVKALLPDVMICNGNNMRGQALQYRIEPWTNISERLWQNHVTVASCDQIPTPGIDVHLQSIRWFAEMNRHRRNNRIAVSSLNVSVDP